MHIPFETRKKNTGFYILKQGVPRGRSSEEYSNFKQVMSWPWHVEVIPGVSAAALLFSTSLLKYNCFAFLTRFVT